MLVIIMVKMLVGVGIGLMETLAASIKKPGKILFFIRRMSKSGR
jgi:hypothetical protein